MKRRGFTLIELMIVVAVIAILALAAVPRAAQLIIRSKEASTKAGLGTLRSAINIYYGDNDSVFPGDDLSCLTAAGRYMDAIPSVFAPNYHPLTNRVENVDSLGAAGLLSQDDGTWHYWNDPTPSGNVDWGMIWIGCSHADTHGVVWSSF